MECRRNLRARRKVPPALRPPPRGEGSAAESQRRSSLKGGVDRKRSRASTQRLTMTILKVRHVTTYRYAARSPSASTGCCSVRATAHDQRLISSDLRRSPPSRRRPLDPRRLRQLDHHRRFRRDAPTSCASRPRSSSTTRPSAARNSASRTRAKTWPFAYDEHTLPDLEPVMRVHYPDPAVEAWARQFVSATGTTETGHLLMTMTTAFRESFSYSRRTDPGTQLPP